MVWKLQIRKGNVPPCRNHDWQKWRFCRWCCFRCDLTQTAREKGEYTDEGCGSDVTDDIANRIGACEVVGMKRMIKLLCVWWRMGKRGGRLGVTMEGGVRRQQAGRRYGGGVIE